MSRDSAPELPLEDRASGARPEEEAPFSVSELLGLVSETLEGQFALVLVVGELTSFKRAPSGHCYFTLSDDSAAVDAVMFRPSAVRVAFDPQVGAEVVCRGKISVYAKQGRMQLVVSAMKPVGEGVAQRTLEALKRTLEAEGLFAAERKRPLPFVPATIGVVTSRAGAALHDILTTIHRRYRYCRVVVSPATVQGAEAPAEIVRALAALAELAVRGECDVAIVGRGGGAPEDLAVFNDERVVRAVASFPVPIVSAVGHEVDFTLCDLAADQRAATPTAAAEAVVPVHSELSEQLASLDLRMHSAAGRYVEAQRHRLGDVAGRLRDPASLVAAGRQRADELAIRLERSLLDLHRRERVRFDDLRTSLQHCGREHGAGLSARVHLLAGGLERALLERYAQSRSTFIELSAKLNALSPLAVLERGYGVATRGSAGDGPIVRSAGDVSPGDDVSLRFHRGSAVARVLFTTDEEKS
ncbi:MAG: exodeoxyribonuclease VII large subunit [Myxococcales bacterium]|nr:MAG: exodeoxyribonuclease VII large subunit [Myxococcales bacterium]